MPGIVFWLLCPAGSRVIRVTRNADLDPDGEGVEEDEDYRQHMKKVLKKRLRLQPVLLAVHGDLARESLKSIRKALGLSQQAVLSVTMPLDLGYIYSLEASCPPPCATGSCSLRSPPSRARCFARVTPCAIRCSPATSCCSTPTSRWARFSAHQRAAHDDTCISLRITLYRVARQSRLCESLISAAERGKEVTVLMELRARFDEENNIAWAERLEEAGCTVIYGAEGFNAIPRSATRPIMTREDSPHYPTGTGNFNERPHACTRTSCS